MTNPTAYAKPIAVFALVLAASAAACGSDPPPTANVPAPPSVGGPNGRLTTAPTTTSAADACSEIAGACHMHDGKDSGGEASLIHECHELGHAHKLDACTAKKQECMAACEPLAAH